MSVYERHQWLYGFQDLHGKPATLQYLPTQRSRKWRSAWVVMSLTEDAEKSALAQMNESGWDAIRFVPW